MNISQFTIEVLIKKFSNNIVNFIKKELIKKLDKNIKIKFDFSEKYWKIPETTQCYFNIYSKRKLYINDILSKFDLKWEVTSIGKSAILHNKIYCIFEDEEAFWNAECENKIFIHPDITWVLINSFPVDPNLEYDDE